MRNLSHRIEKIHVSPIRKVARLLDQARDRRDMISFGGGAPSLPAPQNFLDEFGRILESDPLKGCGYTGTRGIPQLREAVARDIRKYGKVEYSPESEIILTTGATEAIFSTLMSLVDSGDETIITDPTYLGYREMIELAEGRPRFLQVVVDNDYQPSTEQLKELVSKRTKAVLVLSPDNPTGRILNREFVRTLVDLSVDYDFWIVSDDIYKHIVYEGDHVWISSFAGAKDHTITVCSFSKEAGIPGLRLGYTFAPKEIVDSIEKMQQYTTLAPQSLGQFALVKFLDENMKEGYLRDSLAEYARKRDLMGRMIHQYLPQARTAVPAGAFYYFVDFRPYLLSMKLNEDEFASNLLRDRNVAVIPGGFFGDHGRGHIRMTFVTEPDDRIETGIQMMAEYVSIKPN